MLGPVLCDVFALKISRSIEEIKQMTSIQCNSYKNPEVSGHLMQPGGVRDVSPRSWNAG